MNRPPVTVLMATYNAMPYLPAAVESIRRQTLDHWKMVIVDDGSTDDSADYLASLDDSRIEVLWQENQGQQAAANHGLRHCDTEFIARMDADDISHPTRLARQLDFLRRHPRVGLVGAQLRRMGEQAAGYRSSLPCGHDQIVADLLRNRHAMCNASIMFRSALLREAGPYWQFRVSEDWDMFLRMSELAELANLDEVLVDIRIHRGSVNGRRLRECMLMNLYAAEQSRRRRAGLPEISLHEFQAGRGLLTRAGFYLDCQALAHYRVAIADLLGGHPARGWTRMAWAMASWPPRLTQRIKRMVRNRLPRPLPPASSHVPT